MAWTTLASGVLLPGEPFTSAKALAFYNNPIAIADGDSGAPRVQGVALGNVALDWANESGTTATEYTGFTNFDRIVVEYVYEISGGPNGALQISFSDDSGSSWASWQNIIPSTASTEESVVLISVSDAEAVRQDPAGTGTSRLTTLSLTVPSGTDAFRFRSSTGSGGAAYLVKPYVFGGAG